jgi:putative nucleotidyltransferase with HDIG domain
MTATDVDSRLNEIAEKVQRLPALPSVYHRVTELMNDPNSSAAEIGGVVSHDQAIAARLLNVVNSSFYGFRQRINTVTRAMTMIGFRGLKELLLALSVLPAMRDDSSAGPFDTRAFWTHAVGVAACARAAAGILRIPEPEAVFTTGLLHDIGKLGEYQFMRDEFLAAVETAHAENRPIHDVERERFGFSHVDVGRILAQKWQFPESIVEAISLHHAPSRAAKFACHTGIVHLADIIARAKMLGELYDGRVPPLDIKGWEATGLKRSQLDSLMRATEEEFEKGKAFVAIVREGAS